MSELTEAQGVGMAKLCYHLWLCEDPLPSLHLHSSKHMLNVFTIIVIYGLVHPYVCTCLLVLPYRAGVSVVNHY